MWISSTADGAQGPQLAMLQPPANNVFNRMTDLIPGRAKTQRGVLPRQLARPLPQVRARYNMQALVKLCLPIVQGTCSTFIPQALHCTRLMAYNSITR